MQYCKFFLLIALIQLLACKKEKTPTGGSSLTIINAVVGSNKLVTNFSSNYTLSGYYKNARQLSYGSFNTDYQFSTYSGPTHLMLYQYPDTTDHSTPLFNLNMELPVGSIHTLFLTGLIGAPDTLFTTDQPPYHPASDSSVGIRFVNLSYNSNPVNVTLSTSTTVSEFSNVAYKSITGFKSYPAIASVSSYTFQIRDAGSNAVLGSMTMSGINNGTGSNTSTNNYRFRNFTIALVGLPGGTGAAAQKTILINNY